MQNSDPVVKSVAAAVFAKKPAKTDTPIPLRQYIAYYVYRGRWVLTDDPAGLPVYAAGLGDCPPIEGLLGRTYARNNATIHAARCSLLMPWWEGGVVTHYVFTCTYGSDFRPEAAELDVAYNNSVVKIRAVVVLSLIHI